jgi:hypothetical protein
MSPVSAIVKVLYTMDYVTLDVDLMRSLLNHLNDTGMDFTYVGDGLFHTGSGNSGRDKVQLVRAAVDGLNRKHDTNITYLLLRP